MAAFNYVLYHIAFVVLAIDHSSAHPFWWRIRPLTLDVCPKVSSSDHTCYDLERIHVNCTTVVRNECRGHALQKRDLFYKIIKTYGQCYERRTITCVNYKCIEKCCSGWQKGSDGRCSQEVGQGVLECKNGGTPRRSRCFCSPHFTGERCEKPVCERPCQNGGYCIINRTMTIPECVCGANFTGGYCQKPVCGFGCQNSGKCIADKLSVRCLCPDGFYGDHCEKLIKPCKRMPRGFNTTCADKCSVDNPCDKGEQCCEFKGDNICVVNKTFEYQSCHYRNRFNQWLSVRVGYTFMNRLGHLCRCRPNHLGQYYHGIEDCALMRCNIQSTGCKHIERNTSLYSDIYRKPIITNCPLPGESLPLHVNTYNNKAILTFAFIGRDWRGRPLRTFRSQQSFTARNTTHDDIFHSKVTTEEDTYHNIGECCFTVKVIDTTPPSFLSCPVDITAFTGETISWVRPQATDNVGVRKITEPVISNSTVIGIGIHVFIYTAEDWSGNKAQCSFTVEITDWDSDASKWSSSLRSRVESNPAVIVGAIVVGILGIVLFILALIVVRSCRVRARQQREMSGRIRGDSTVQRSSRLSVYSIYNTEPPPYDIAAKDKLPEYTPRDDPPLYREKVVDGFDNWTFHDVNLDNLSST